MEDIAEPCNCLECLKRCEYFQRLSEGELARVNSLKAAYKYRKGDVIVRRGDYNPYIVQISQGYVKMIIEGESEKCFILEVMGKQNFVASGFSGDKKSQFTLIALSEVLVCYIDIHIFLELLETNGLFAVDVLKYIDINEERRLKRMMSISLKQTRGKVADALLYIKNMSVEESLFKYLSRSDIAEMANLSTENTIRTLKEFEDEGMISIDKKEIELKDNDALINISLKG